MSNSNAQVATQVQCRLCDGGLVEKFQAKILNKYTIRYYECSHCRSLQTEKPYWLDEAYAITDFNLDTGALQRNLNNFAVCYTLTKILTLNNVVDFGAKDGVLCRFLRDHMINCYAYDKYSPVSYAIDFEASQHKGEVDLVVAFEVFEHLPNPKTDLDEIFSFKSKYVLVSTELYSNQGLGWWYLTERTGQHVFLYSAQAIAFIAQRYGYGATMLGNMILFYKLDIPNIEEKLIAAQTALTGWIFQAIKSYIFLLPTPGVQADYDMLKAKLTKPGA